MLPLCLAIKKFQLRETGSDPAKTVYTTSVAIALGKVIHIPGWDNLSVCVQRPGCVWGGGQ